MPVGFCSVDWTPGSSEPICNGQTCGLASAGEPYTTMQVKSRDLDTQTVRRWLPWDIPQGCSDIWSDADGGLGGVGRCSHTIKLTAAVKG